MPNSYTYGVRITRACYIVIIRQSDGRVREDDTSVCPGASGDGMPRGVVDSQDVDDGTDVDIAHFPAER